MASNEQKRSFVGDLEAAYKEERIKFEKVRILRRNFGYANRITAFVQKVTGGADLLPGEERSSNWGRYGDDVVDSRAVEISMRFTIQGPMEVVTEEAGKLRPAYAGIEGRMADVDGAEATLVMFSLSRNQDGGMDLYKGSKSGGGTIIHHAPPEMTENIRVTMETVERQSPVDWKPKE